MYEREFRETVERNALRDLSAGFRNIVVGVHDNTAPGGCEKSGSNFNSRHARYTTAVTRAKQQYGRTKQNQINETLIK